jgi:hypothetical protein
MMEKAVCTVCMCMCGVTVCIMMEKAVVNRKPVYKVYLIWPSWPVYR